MLSHKQLVIVCLFLSLFTFSTFTKAKSTQQYVVTHVASNDTLNIRSGAGVGNEVIATIPFNGRGIQAVGEERRIGKTVWIRIIWQNTAGWVSKYYLQAMPLPASNTDHTDTKKQDSPAFVSNVTAETQQKPLLIKKTAVEAETKLEIEVATATETTEITETTTKNTEDNIVTTTFENSPIEPEPESESADIVDVETDFSKDLVTTEEEKKVAGNWILQCGDKKPYWKVQLHPNTLNIFRDDDEHSLPITLKKQHKNKWNTALKTIVKGQKGKNNLEMIIKYAYSKRCYDTLSSLVVPYKVTTVFNGETLTGCCHAVKLEDERQISKAP